MRPLSSSSLRVVRASDGVAVGEISNVCIVLWRDEVTRARFDVQRDGLFEVMRRHPERTGFLCVIEPTAAPPNNELRRAVAAMIREKQAELRCIACVVEGTGFRNAIARSALSAMALLIGTRTVPFSVFGTVDACVAWMMPRVDAKDAATLAGSVEAVRAAIVPPAGGRSL